MWRSTSRSRGVSWSSSGSTGGAAAPRPRTRRARSRRAAARRRRRRRPRGARRRPARRRDRLGHVAARAGADDGDHVLGRVRPTARGSAGPGARRDAPDHLDAAAVRHLDVEQHDVGLGLDDPSPIASPTVAGVAHDVDQPVELGAHAGAGTGGGRRRSRREAVALIADHQLDLGARAGRGARRAAAVALHPADDRLAHAAPVGGHGVEVEARARGRARTPRRGRPRPRRTR